MQTNGLTAGGFTMLGFNAARFDQGGPAGPPYHDNAPGADGLLSQRRAKHVLRERSQEPGGGGFFR